MEDSVFHSFDYCSEDAAVDDGSVEDGVEDGVPTSKLPT
eukprot:CAMPEP_0172328792 /NCGR_PEP_ID=MMETSP1058-20130122/60535_1 /TAXON_ID=83371 /ORGANISM="Detonula confervacea, Strain CCMP 353" /LENGTH=38 /DNA_ID= /DNA_START= /DNA_END= /DNA_ORIENTATION=